MKTPAYFLVCLILFFVYGDLVVTSTLSEHVSVNTSVPARQREFLVSLDSASANKEGKITLTMESSKIVTFDVKVACYNNTQVFFLHVTSLGRIDVLTIDQKILRLYCNKTNNSVDGNIASLDDSSRHFNRNNSVTSLNKTIVNDFINQQVNITLNAGAIGISGISFDLYDHGDVQNSTWRLKDTFRIANDRRNLSNRTIQSPGGPTGRTTELGTWYFEVYVVREPHPIDLAFVVCIYAMEILEMVMFGTQLDMPVIKRTMKKPVAPLIGFLCQYVGMPLIAYAIARVITTEPLMSLGIFVAGICPGGGSSNIYAYLLDGDLSLSITMTTISTLMSLAMMPLWLYTLGREFMDAYNLNIPYSDIALTLSVIIIPLAIGLLINHKYPKSSEYVQKVVTWVLTMLVVCLIVTGVLSSLYIFRLFNLTVILVGLTLPYIGFFLGGLAAVLCRQPWGNIKTIALETGLQNTGIGFILLYGSFLPPLGDIATVAPLAAEVMSPIPPLLISIAYLIRKCCLRRYKAVKASDTEQHNSANGQCSNVDNNLEEKGIEFKDKSSRAENGLGEKRTELSESS